MEVGALHQKAIRSKLIGLRGLSTYTKYRTVAYFESADYFPVESQWVPTAPHSSTYDHQSEDLCHIWRREDQRWGQPRGFSATSGEYLYWCDWHWTGTRQLCEFLRPKHLRTLLRARHRWPCPSTRPGWSARSSYRLPKGRESWRNGISHRRQHRLTLA